MDNPKTEMKLSMHRSPFAALFTCLALASAFATAQNPAPVEELGVSNAKKVAPVPASQGQTNPGDSFYQYQVLREEVRQLRGMVEQLSYELQRVKQRQMDDYLDIDRRLSAAMAALESGATVAPVDSQSAIPELDQQPLNPGQPLPPQSTAAPEPALTQQPAYNSEEIAANYAQASNLLLKERNLVGAVAAFKQHITDYPDSPYLANAYYWLGEIYLLEGQDELARQAFTMVVEKHPDHGKALDANFKLGKIYHQLGELDRAKTLLETAAQGAGGASNKAKSYLQNNF